MTCLSQIILFHIHDVVLRKRQASDAKTKARLKCPLLNKFIRESVAELKGNFVTTHEIFGEYKIIVALWTDDDSVTVQARYLIKQNSFNKVSMLLSRMVLSHQYSVKPWFK